MSRRCDRYPVLKGHTIQDTSNDLLIIGAGYDHPLIAHAAEFKSNARKLQVLGFPSLRPDMYQENVLQVQKAAEHVGGRGDGMDTVFVPANDPFNTALKLHNVVEQFSKTKPITNLYLCPIFHKGHDRRLRLVLSRGV